MDIVLMLADAAEATKTEVKTDVFWSLLLKFGLPAVAFLFGVIGLLASTIHRQMTNDKTELNKKLDLCEKKHDEQNEWAISMSTKVGKLEGMMEGHAQARQDLKNLSNTVIELLTDKDKEKVQE